MSKIKSKRAKECADRYISTGVHKGVHRYKYVIQAIELAEQDAENRAIEAYCKSECDEDSSCPKRETCYILKMFVDNLNNGGQSDE